MHHKQANVYTQSLQETNKEFIYRCVRHRNIKSLHRATEIPMFKVQSLYSYIHPPRLILLIIRDILSTGERLVQIFEDFQQLFNPNQIGIFLNTKLTTKLENMKPVQHSTVYKLEEWSA